MFDHPQVLNQGLIATYQHPVVGQYRGLKRSVRFARTPGPEPFAAPTLGQHTEIIKEEALRLRRIKNKS
jgi:crotonobetainyl-CoA:carnitine CoA-transferase CaiB-like acyl-CoA transferase